MNNSKSHRNDRFANFNADTAKCRYVACLTAKTDFTKSVFDLIEYRGLSLAEGAWVDQTRRRIDAKEAISAADQRKFDQLHKQILGVGDDDQDPPSNGTQDTEGEGSDDADDDEPDGFERSITDRPPPVFDEEDEKAKGERPLQVEEPQTVQPKEPIQKDKKKQKRLIQRPSRRDGNGIG